MEQLHIVDVFANLRWQTLNVCVCIYNSYCVNENDWKSTQYFCLCYQTVVLLDVLSIFLTDKNENGFTSLHSESSGTGGRALLHSAEMYGQYVGQILVNDDAETMPSSISRENLGK